MNAGQFQRHDGKIHVELRRGVAGFDVAGLFLDHVGEAQAPDDEIFIDDELEALLPA